MTYLGAPRNAVARIYSRLLFLPHKVFVCLFFFFVFFIIFFFVCFVALLFFSDVVGVSFC